MSSQPPPIWVRIMVSNARQRALAKGMHFELTEKDVADLWQDQNGLCYWFQVPMHWQDEAGPRSPLIPTLDRTDNNRGYVRSNVVLACWGANAAKGACDLDHWEEFLDFLRSALRS